MEGAERVLRKVLGEARRRQKAHGDMQAPQGSEDAIRYAAKSESYELFANWIELEMKLYGLDPK